MGRSDGSKEADKEDHLKSFRPISSTAIVIEKFTVFLRYYTKNNYNTTYRSVVSSICFNFQLFDSEQFLHVHERLHNIRFVIADIAECSSTSSARMNFLHRGRTVERVCSRQWRRVLVNGCRRTTHTVTTTARFLKAIALRSTCGA